MAGKYIEFEVTNEDIRIAGKAAFNCPVAQALHRKYPTLPFSPNSYFGSLGQGHSIKVYRSDIRVAMKHYKPSEKLGAIITNFDITNKFVPGRYRAFEAE